MLYLPSYQQFKVIHSRTKEVGINIGFLVKVRIILDFKYKEFISHGHKTRLNTDFVDYVYWWLDEYSLHSKTHQVTESETTGYFDHGPHCQ